MKGYAEREVFTPRELRMLRRATDMVARVPFRVRTAGSGLQAVRCHELARAIGKILPLEVADGFYGFVEHSWLWTTKPDRIDGRVLGPLPNILDVYMPGHVPPVQLVHMYSGLCMQYRPGPTPDDINDDVVGRLVVMAQGRRKRS